jgi:hypothetical protein
MKRIIVAAFIMMLAACGTPTSETETTDAPRTTEAPKPQPTKPQADAQAQLACDHFRNVADDIAAGVLTEEQITTKLQEVYGTGRRSESPGIAQASQSVVAAWNRRDFDALLTTSKKLLGACEKLGH